MRQKRMPGVLWVLALLVAGCQGQPGGGGGGSQTNDDGDQQGAEDDADAPSDVDLDDILADIEAEAGAQVPDVDPFALDSDGDGLSDGDEALLSTSPFNPDTDFDGLLDGEEVAFGSDPTLRDTDADGLNDLDEFELGTDPRLEDTDSDGLLDGDDPEPLVPWTLLSFLTANEATFVKSTMQDLEREIEGYWAVWIQQRLDQLAGSGLGQSGQRAVLQCFARRSVKQDKHDVFILLVRDTASSFLSSSQESELTQLANKLYPLTTCS